MTTEKRHFEVILAGTGGQGLILSGILLADAAILEGKNVVQTQSYGIASRGGLSLAEVIIDTEEIIFQQVQKPDCILALTEEAAKKYEAWAARGVPILYDSTLANARTAPNFTGHAFTQTASDMGNEGSVNILAPGDRGREDGRREDGDPGADDPQALQGRCRRDESESPGSRPRSRGPLASHRIDRSQERSPTVGVVNEKKAKWHRARRPARPASTCLDTTGNPGGRFEEALSVIREKIPFPSSAGMPACTPARRSARATSSRAPWRSACSSASRPRKAGKNSEACPMSPRAGRSPSSARDRQDSVRPTTSTLQGHDVTVFEALAEGGGLLRYGIPGYRLPDAVVTGTSR